MSQRVSFAAISIACVLAMVGNQNCAPVNFKGAEPSAQGTTISSTGVPNPVVAGSITSVPTGNPGTDVVIPVNPGPGPFAFPIPVTIKEKLKSRKNFGSCCFGDKRTGTSIPECPHIKGIGTAQSPYEIHEPRDIACVDYAPDAHWNLKADITIRPEDYQKSKLKRFVPIRCFGGVFDGEFRKIRHEVDCSKFDCSGKSESVIPNIALIGQVGGVIMNLHLEADYRARAPQKRGTQVASGLGTESIGSLVLRVSMKGRFDVDAQYITGLINSDNPFDEFSLYVEQAGAEFEVINPKPHNPQYTAGLLSGADRSFISNSYAKHNHFRKQHGTGSIGLVSSFGFEKGSNVQNSFHAGDFALESCGVPFKPLVSGGSAKNSFWTGTVKDKKGNVCEQVARTVPYMDLQRNGPALSGVFDEFGFDDQYWSRGADGLPKLRWIP